MPHEVARRNQQLRYMWLITAACCCVTPASEIALSPAARASLAAAACWSVGATRIETLRARAVEKRPADVTADVKCLAHMEEDSHPVSHYTRCEQHGGTWKCDDGYNALMLSPTNGPALLLIPKGMSFRAALDLLPDLATLRNRVGRPAMSYLHGRCAVGRSVPFKDAEQFDFVCDDGRREITLTRDCVRNPCRVYLVDARDVPK